MKIRKASWLPGLCLCLLLPGVSRADPAFPAAIGARPAWPPGVAGAFHPVRPPAGQTIYVDGSNGSDSGSGSQADPVRTITQGLARARAGDTVLVLAGTYREQVIIPDMNPAPSRAAPLVLRAEPADGQSVIIDGSGLELQLEGSLQNPAGVSIHRDGAVVLEGFRIQNFSGYGVAVQQSSDAVIRGCTLQGNGSGMADSVDLVIISSQQVRVWGNTFLGNSTTERALDDRSTASWIAYNDFSGYRVNCIKAGPHPAGAGSRIEHNRFTSNSANQGVVLLDQARGVAVFRNLLAGGSLQGIRLEESRDCRVLLNTITGFQFALELHFAARCLVSGNIFAGNTVGVEYLSPPADSQPDGNLYFDNTADSDGQGDTGPGAMFADPGFADAAGGDYSLAGGAYAIDRGPADLPVPEGGGGRVDLGAFEYDSGQPPWHYQPAGTVADLTPEFFWSYTDSAGGSQGAFRVQLDRSPTFDTEDLIDSNYVNDGTGAWTVPDDLELAEGRWYVRVTTRDDANQPGPWSAPGLAFTVEQAPTCNEQGGSACQALDGCSGDWLVAGDSSRCCAGDCVACPDADSDGYLDATCGGPDCDDGNAQVHPDAAEDCENGVDDDCDGLTDLDDEACGCVDHDRDGYGRNCPDGPDCDDTIASVHPGAEELCNNTDDDCDGQIDEGFNLQADPDNCGECGWVCRESAGEVCDLGQCTSACGPGRSDCDRWCIDTSSDLENCGGCGLTCDLAHASESCSQGQCLLTACETGWVDLDGASDNGCEYACSPATGGGEECGNGSDDDCDGLTDEDCSGGCSCSPPGHPGTGAAALLLLLLCLVTAATRRSGP